MPQLKHKDLICRLYELAQRKQRLENLRAGANVERDQALKARHDLNNTRHLLRFALTKLQDATNLYPDTLRTLENWWFTLPISFDEVISFLEVSLEAIEELHKAYAAAIHPQLRNKTHNLEEAALAQGEGLTPIAPAFKFPARNKSVKIDQAFVEAADALIDDWRDTHPGIKLPSNAKIISGAFTAAFGEKYEVSSVHRQLKRNKKRLAPRTYVL